ncbi:MAG: hypothetical protein KGS48_01940 [Bacteroidetes bacterium]|nr:hypothetical protein [Bacteroidota bacterium]
MRKIRYLGFICLLWCHVLTGQQIYEAVNGATSSIWLLDAGNCTRTEIVSNITPDIDDFVEVPGGGFFMVSSPYSSLANFYSIDPSSGATTLLLSFSIPTGSGPSRLLLVSSTEILWAVRGRFYIFDLSTNTLTLVATYPPTFFAWHLYMHNGQIYYSEESIPGSFNENMYTLSLTPTFSRTLIATVPGNWLELGNIRDIAEACDQLYSGGSTQMLNYNLNNYTTSIHCSWPGGGSSIRPVAPLLAGTSGPACGCTTDAGTWNYNISTNQLVEVCAGGIIDLPHSGDEVLNAGQNLSFALYALPFVCDHYYECLTSSNLLYVYSSDQLNFLPGITEVNQLYVIIPIASEAPPGSFNLDDPCRDLQEPLYVRWRTPTVGFTENNPVACGTGCRTLQLTFDGSAPFTLTYSVNPSVNGVLQTFTQTFTSSTATIVTCPPPGYTGTIEVKALSLSDNSGCTCN